MSAKVHAGILPGDTAVRVESVSKIFYRKQRAEGFKESLKSLFKPKVSVIHALNDISFTVKKGEILAYAGANGSGKSTTIRLISGLLSPDEGNVAALAMNPVNDRVGYMKRTGVLFGQRTELWWDHPVRMSFEWKRVVWEIPKDRYESMKNILIELLDIGEFFDTHVRELSLGQRMRADLAMALLNEPELLLLDEPTLGLDVLAKRRIITFLKEINLRTGMTIIVTSHDMDDLMEMAGRIILLNGGEIAYDGSFEKLRVKIGGQRILVLTTNSDKPLKLDGTVYEMSQDNRHRYRIDTENTSIAEVVRDIPAHVLLDIETQHPPFEEQIAQLYDSWRSQQ